MKKIVWPPGTQLAPVPVVLVGTGGHGFPDNLLTVAWTGIACSDPPMLTIAVRPERFSYAALRETGEFTVNIPTERMAPAVDWCGVVSGRDHDKFAERHLTPLPASKIEAPVVGECPLSLECRTVQVIEPGVHHLFLAKILAVQVSEKFMDPSGRFDLEKQGLLAYVHGHYFGLGSCLGHFGFSVRRKKGPRTRRS